MSTESFIVNITLRDYEQAQQQVALSFITKMNLINNTLWEQMTQTQTVTGDKDIGIGTMQWRLDTLGRHWIDR